MKLSFRLCGALLYFAALHFAAAQAYPAKPIRLIMPLVAGSASNDILGRALAQRVSESLGQPVVVDYRPGAAGNIGSSLAAKAPPDGYTLLIGYTSSIMISPILHPSADYHPLTDLAPIARFATVPYVVVAHPSVPATNLKELIALARARPGELHVASAGSGSLPHLAAELFKMITKVDIVHVPYKGAAPAANDLIGGHVQLSFSGITGIAPSIKAGKLRALAVTMPKRSALLPDVPTSAESGLPGFEVTSSLGILAPAKTPATIVRRLYDEIAKIVNGADMKRFIHIQGAEPALMDAAQFAEHIKTEAAKWASVIKTANVKAD